MVISIWNKPIINTEILNHLKWIPLSLFVLLLFHSISLHRRTLQDSHRNFHNPISHTLFLILFSISGLGGLVGGFMSLTGNIQLDTFGSLFVGITCFYYAFVFIYSMFLFPYKKSTNTISAQPILD
ncbi:hypothetical protein BST86_08185 [Nonlabens agnitus]|uniref:Uncharacterized protein n=1 Tax=Nonlabens agnitus TaxID=870484 RepID=A0A2S9WUE4_9FLAO|nr:hypothetical protein BST86_08185 [Nonlabens agnitus]